MTTGTLSMKLLLCCHRAWYCCVATWLKVLQMHSAALSGFTKNEMDGYTLHNHFVSFMQMNRVNWAAVIAEIVVLMALKTEIQ